MRQSRQIPDFAAYRVSPLTPGRCLQLLHLSLLPRSKLVRCGPSITEPGWGSLWSLVMMELGQSTRLHAGQLGRGSARLPLCTQCLIKVGGGGPILAMREQPKVA